MVRCSGLKMKDCEKVNECSWTVGKGCGKTQEAKAATKKPRQKRQQPMAVKKPRAIPNKTQNKTQKDQKLMNLPNDVLDIIAMKIKNPANLAQLGAVSKHWHQRIGKVNSGGQIGKTLAKAIEDIFAHRELPRVILRLSIGGVIIECTVNYPRGKIIIKACTEPDAKRSRLYSISRTEEKSTTSIKVLQNYLVKGTELQNKLVFSRSTDTDNVRRYGANISQLPTSFTADSFLDILGLMKDISDVIGQKPRLEIINYYSGDIRKILSTMSDTTKVELKKVVRGLRELTFRISPIQWAVYRDTDEFLDRVSYFAMDVHGNIVRVRGHGATNETITIKEEQW